MKKWFQSILAMTVVSGLFATGCGSTLSASASGTAGRQPDVNGDGKVAIGLMSPGDTKDNGYYQSFVDEARAFAEANGWSVVILDKINPSDSITQAKNLCRQSVDLIAIGASELKDALSAAPEPVCKGVHWYINGGVGVEQTEYFAQSQQNVKEILFAGGMAAGLLLKESGSTKAGYISGPEIDFSKQAAAGFLAGLRAIVPEATLVETYTGDLNDSGKAREAAQAQVALGVKVIYPISVARPTRSPPSLVTTRSTRSPRVPTGAPMTPASTSPWCSARGRTSRPPSRSSRRTPSRWVRPECGESEWTTSRPSRCAASTRACSLRWTSS